MSDTPPQLKGEVEGPREDLGGNVSSSLIPDFMRKRKETTPLISNEVFRRHHTTPGESTLSSASGAKSPPPLQRSVSTNCTTSRRGGTGEGSLLCSPLPSPFRRERNASKSQPKEPIGIFEGLVKLERPTVANAIEHDNTQPSSQQKQELAADSLRKRLKAELRPHMSMEHLQQIQIAQRSHDEAQRCFFSRSGNTYEGTGAEELPTSGIQRVSRRRWDNKTPSKISRGWVTEVINDYEYTFSKNSNDSQEVESAGPSRRDDLSEVALASVPGTQTVYPNRNLDYTDHHDSTSTEVANSGGATNSPEENGNRNGVNGLPVVVANAECELKHPRPSRRSEGERIKALCKEEAENNEDHQGRRRKSAISGRSSASYHTAPVTASFS
ncbi:hypothetical protein VM1G_11943 [Cytospora mali]|uniref:Uncharacterized protein n=1 Tax=Cytospora mali TaxID=578113 RepID=A0A194WCE9_CYTMA|nr:hypothetical protein VM1G_11943 [Valsa mali]